MRAPRTMLLSRLVLAAVCVMPIADLALSDAASIWVLRHADAAVSQGAGIFGRVAEDGIVGGFIFLASVVLALPVTRMRRLQGVIEGFDDCEGARRAGMTRWRAALSRALNAPLVALGRAAERTERFGVVLGSGHPNSRTRRALAHLLVDVGQVNAIETTANVARFHESRIDPG